MKLLLEGWRRFVKETENSWKRPENNPTWRGREVPEKPFYHGTTTALEIGDFILPPKQTGKQTEPRVQRRGKIFLTQDLDYAYQYANIATKKWGGEPVVYEVIPDGYVKQIAGPPKSAFHAEKAKIYKKIEKGEV